MWFILTFLSFENIEFCVMLFYHFPLILGMLFHLLVLKGWQPMKCDSLASFFSSKMCHEYLIQAYVCSFILISIFNFRYNEDIFRCNVVFIDILIFIVYLNIFSLAYNKIDDIGPLADAVAKSTSFTGLE